MSTKLLLVEDEVDLALATQFYLEKHGFDVHHVENGADALAALEEETYDAMLLDWMMPQVSGIQVLKELKQKPEIQPKATLMVSARDMPNDRLKGLLAGAVDYISKPFSLEELRIRIEKCISRVIQNPSSKPPQRYGRIQIDHLAYVVYVDGQPIDLTTKEYKLLVLLAENLGKMLSRPFLMERIWGNSVELTQRTVDSCIKRLRKKLGRAGKQIQSLSNAGYSLSIA